MNEPSQLSSGHPGSDADFRRERFLHMLVHELRNPLAPIQNAVEVLKLSRPVSERVDHCSDMIDRQVSRMAHLLDNLIDTGRLTNGGLELKVGRAGVRSVLEQALARAEPAIAERAHRVEVDLPPASVTMAGDAPRLIQLFTNLLDNAAKFTNRGGTITLTHALESDHVVIMVADTGMGIDGATEPFIFEPFALAGTARPHAGNSLGLGLPIAQGIARAHGGMIEYRSRGSGLGSEFRVRLPVAVNAEPAAEPEKSRTAGAAERWRMVLADDRQLNADALSELIRLQGHDVVTVYDGEAAVEAAQQIRPNVVVLDIGMPGVDGYEACRRIRAETWGRDIPIIALTGWGQHDTVTLTREAGFTHHLFKPVDHLTLLGNLEQWRQSGSGPIQA